MRFSGLSAFIVRVRYFCNYRLSQKIKDILCWRSIVTIENSALILIIITSNFTEELFIAFCHKTSGEKVPTSIYLIITNGFF